MSALGRRNGKAVDAAVRVDAPARVLRVRWTVSLAALAGAQGHGPELQEALKRWRSGADPTLEWTVEESGEGGAPWVARASLRGPTAVTLFVSNGSTRVDVTDDPESGTRHVEVREGARVLLSAALDLSRGAAMYASTSLLATLGLAGGRYEVAP